MYQNNKIHAQMPQLDKITFFSQFFWLSFFYLGFYFLIYKYFLPKMSRTLKFRKRRMNNSQQGVTSMGEEGDKVGTSYQALLSTGLTTCKGVFNQNYKGAEDWLNDTVSQANQTRLKNTNTAYISSLGERSISQRVVLSQTFVDVSEKTSFALLINKLKDLNLAKQGIQGRQGRDTIRGNVGPQQSLKQHKPKSAEKAQAISTSTEGRDTTQVRDTRDTTQGIQKPERLGKNKTKQNREIEQVVGKDSSAKSKVKGSANKGGKNKTGKKETTQ